METSCISFPAQFSHCFPASSSYHQLISQFGQRVPYCALNNVTRYALCTTNKMPPMLHAGSIQLIVSQPLSFLGCFLDDLPPHQVFHVYLFLSRLLIQTHRAYHGPLFICALLQLSPLQSNSAAQARYVIFASGTVQKIFPTPVVTMAGRTAAQLMNYLADDLAPHELQENLQSGSHTNQIRKPKTRLASFCSFIRDTLLK